MYKQCHSVQSCSQASVKPLHCNQPASRLHDAKTQHSLPSALCVLALIILESPSTPSLTCSQQVLHALECQEPVGVLRLTDAVKKQRQVVVVVQLVKVDLFGMCSACVLYVVELVACPQQSSLSAARTQPAFGGKFIHCVESLVRQAAGFTT